MQLTCDAVSLHQSDGLGCRARWWWPDTPSCPLRERRTQRRCLRRGTRRCGRRRARGLRLEPPPGRRRGAPRAWRLRSVRSASKVTLCLQGSQCQRTRVSFLLSERQFRLPRRAGGAAAASTRRLTHADDSRNAMLQNGFQPLYSGTLNEFDERGLVKRERKNREACNVRHTHTLQKGEEGAETDLCDDLNAVHWIFDF